ncbi:hypothetical protein O1K_07337 [Xanthomonas fragariae LMG 25863]|nr:hypothetical protein O1K_07337 [Xanthomonas fragariae LMG 25863]
MFSTGRHASTTCFFQQDRLLAGEARILFDAPYAEGRWASDHDGVRVHLQL